jgi:Ca-activated chloride channel family protein
MFRYPALLGGLAALPLFWWALARTRRQRRDTVIAFTGAELAGELASNTPPRRLPQVLFSLALLSIAGAAAAPVLTGDGLEQSATVVLVIDTSTSMLAEDVAPNRLNAAQNAAMQFSREVPDSWRIAVVGFAADASVVAAPTTERVRVLEGIAALVPSMGTATGDALDLAIDVGRSGSAERMQAAIAERDNFAEPSKALIVLLSDGAQTAGGVAWRDAALRAATLGIPVYTVALGTPDGTILAGESGREVVRVPPDTVAMQEIARLADGTSFAADDLATLTEAYASVGTKLEVTEKVWDLAPWLAGLAALFALAGTLTLLRRR